MNRSVLTRGALVGVAIAALTLAGCGTSGDTPEPNTSTTANEFASLSGSIKGSGATFPNPYYQYAIDKFADVAEGLTSPIRSAVRAPAARTSPAPQRLRRHRQPGQATARPTTRRPDAFLYVPTVAAPITVSYNLAGVTKVQLSASTLAKIFARTVKTWNDPAIAADNTGVTLPSKPIVVVHRAEGSGTTNNFTSFLDKAAKADWSLGRGDTVAWAADTQQGQGNAGVAQLVKQTDGAIGYVDFGDATASQLTFASIKNKAGKFVAPSVDGATAAVAGATVKDDLSYDPLDAAGDTAYPITAPTYLLVIRSTTTRPRRLTSRAS